MTACPRTSPSSRIRQVALIASLALIAGCGGEPPVNDTAEVIKPEPTKPGPPVPVSTQTPTLGSDARRPSDRPAKG